MMGLLWSLLGIVSGTFIALQAPINAALAAGLGLPVAAAAASFVAGGVCWSPLRSASARCKASRSPGARCRRGYS